ncbi:MAG: sugar ABC transporter substrate-binding protein [Suipraeoptans sp.]
MKKKSIMKLVACILAMVMCMSLVACGSGSSDSDTTTEEETATESESEATDEEAQVSTEGFEGPTEAAKAPEELKVAFVPADASLSGCIVPVEAMEEICDRYGWEYQTFNGEGTTEGYNSAIMNAVAWSPDVICTVSILASAVQQGIKAAVDAGIPITSGSNGTDDPNPKLDLEYDFAYDIGPDYAGLGAEMARWIKDNTEGSGKVVTFDCPGSYSVEYFFNGLFDEMDAQGIEYTKGSDFTFDQLGDELNRMIISYLTNNPDTEFVYLPFDPAAVEVVEGLETAGFTDIKILGTLGNTEMCNLIRQGSIATATAAYDNVYLGYAQMDQAIRLINDQDLISPRGENLPFAIIDATNVPDGDTAWAPTFDYKSAYYALWD